jgi:hypothetical protein
MAGAASRGKKNKENLTDKKQKNSDPGAVGGRLHGGQVMGAGRQKMQGTRHGERVGVTD